MRELFSIREGLSFSVSLREFGSQDKGISPKGAQDQLSFAVAHKLLDKPPHFQSIEIIYPGKITANEDLLMVVSGAFYETTKTDEQDIAYNQVFRLTKGETIEFGGVKKGFRTIVLAIALQGDKRCLIGNKRSKELEEFITLNYRDNFIRVVKGPEYNILKDDSLFETTWSISPNSSQMGISLNGANLDTQKIEMISQPVADGTIQLSPNGPIVLMRHRQTAGGYPRILNVIEPDISKLSQFAPGSKIIFKLVELDEAVKQNTSLKLLLS